MENGKKNKIHFIGIGGIGMSGLAEYYLKCGWSVRGSDLYRTSITERLESIGAEIFYTHSANNLDEKTDIVVFTSAVKDDNEELIESKRKNIKVFKRAELLGEIVNDKFLIAVAGTHGKTTTTAMIGKVMVETGFDPLIFVGGNIPLFEGASVRFGNSSYAVVEADEYDRSFLTLNPDIIVITNIDADHLDIYSGLEDIKATFKQFCKNSKQNSKIIFCGDDANASETVSTLEVDFYSYGFDEINQFTVFNYSTDRAKITFNIRDKVQTYPGITLNIPGRHNALNSCACFVVSRLLEIPFPIYKKSIAEFQTVDRRLQLKYGNEKVLIYDDYAHHPSEIEASIRALKESQPDKNIIVIFQPHLFTRTGDLFKEIAKSLSLADEVIILDIYPARETPIENVTSGLIEDEMKNYNTKARYIKNSDQLIQTLKCIDLKNDIVVFMGAGDITELCNNFIKELKN